MATTHADLRRLTWIATIRLALVMSTAAALLAIGVSSVGDVPAIALVAPVMIVGFVTSWVQTGRVARDRHHTGIPLIQTIHAR